MAPSGVVVAGAAGGQYWGYFCQVNATANGVAPETCKAVLSVLLTAQAADKQVQISYNDDHDCAWHASNGGWAYLTTWNFGPTLVN